jgi:hypothetical protein
MPGNPAQPESNRRTRRGPPGFVSTRFWPFLILSLRQAKSPQNEGMTKVLNRSFGAVPWQEVILRQIEDLSVPVKLELVWRQDNRSAALARLVETVAARGQVMLTKRQQS